jgi:hypothetical protein
MAGELTPPRVLRPAPRRRLAYFIGAVLLLAFSVVGLFYAPVVAALGVLLFGFAAVNGAFRAFHPLSYATRLDGEGFEVFGALGKRVHHIRWAQVAHLTVFHANGFTGPGTVLTLAWRCEPRCPGHGRQPWVRGGRNKVGEEYDGALPDPYLGIEPMLELFSGYADAAGRRPAGDLDR